MDLTAFRAGCALIGFEPSAQQDRFGRIMEATDADGAALHDSMALTEPRRCGKTEGVWGLVIGRCTTRDDYLVAFSAQTGQKGRKRFLELVKNLRRWDPCPRPGRTSPGCQRTDAGHVHRREYLSNGGELITWDNGSSLSILPPAQDAYRSDAYDLIVLDEGQEMTDKQEAAELLGGILATMDTRPGAQLIVAGTAGKVRSGLLWDALEKGRRGEWAILEYAAPLEADPHDEGTWLAAHPGIGTLTTIETIRKRYRDLPSLVEFQREYLGQWPPDASVSAIDPAAWAKAAGAAARGRRVVLAFDVAPDASCAALSCAWRDDAGRAWIELLEFKAGVAWLPGLAHEAARKMHATIAYDGIGQNVNPAEAVSRKTPKVKLAVSTMKDTAGAAQRLVSELEAGRLRHLGQREMTAAAEGASWRSTSGDTARMFGHKASAEPITPLTSAALALWWYDKTTRRRRTPAGVRPSVERVA